MGERLVFVTIKDGPTLPSGRPLRRAVVPVDSATTWESFQKVVIKKLRVTQIGSFFTKQVRLPSLRSRRAGTSGPSPGKRCRKPARPLRSKSTATGRGVIHRTRAGGRADWRRTGRVTDTLAD